MLEVNDGDDQITTAKTYYIHTYIHTCIHTYIHAYIHTCRKLKLKSGVVVKDEGTLMIYPPDARRLTLM